MSESRKKRAPFFVTALGLVCAAMLLFVLSALMAAAAVVAFANPEISFANDSQRVLAQYAAFLPSVLVAMIAASLMIVGSVRWAMYGRHATGSAEGDDVATELLESINSRMMVSDTAKRIAYREEDIALLMRTIKMDVEKRHFDAALALVRELGESYGQVEQAEAFREKILQIRRNEMDAAVTQSLARLKEIVAVQDFDTATIEAEKIARLYPESELARQALERVDQAREAYKHDLERQFLTAAENGDVAQAMQLLKEMDKYLTEQEAEPFQETARGVIGQARDNLGVHFKMAVHDREWVEAVNVGEQIIRDFPNTKMADEVRGMLDLLRQRAAGQQAATLPR